MYFPFTAERPFAAIRNEKSGIAKSFILLKTLKSITCNAVLFVLRPMTVKIAAAAYPARIPMINGMSFAIFLPNTEQIITTKRVTSPQASAT